MNYHIDEDEVPAVRLLLQKTSDMMRPQKSYQNKYLAPSFLRNTDALVVCEPVAEMFKPIFPRSRLPGFGGQTMNPLPELKGLADLPSKTHKVEVEEIHPSPSRMNLVIVDGWGKNYLLCSTYLSKAFTLHRNHQVVSSLDTVCQE